MDNWILPLLQQWQSYWYLLVLAGMLIEGSATLFVVVFLVTERVLSPYALSVVFGGAFVEEVAWYFLGRHFRSSDHRIAGWAKKITGPFEKHLTDHLLRTLLISKFIYGIHRAVMLRAGILGMKSFTFVKYVAFVLGVWMLVIGILGFAAGASYAVVGKYLGYIEFVILGGIILVLLFRRFISERLKKRI